MRDGDDGRCWRAAPRCCGWPSSSSARATRSSTARACASTTGRSSCDLEADEDVTHRALGRRSARPTCSSARSAARCPSRLDRRPSAADSRRCAGPDPLGRPGNGRTERPRCGVSAGARPGATRPGAPAQHRQPGHGPAPPAQRAHDRPERGAAAAGRLRRGSLARDGRLEAHPEGPTRRHGDRDAAPGRARRRRLDRRQRASVHRCADRPGGRQPAAFRPPLGSDDRRHDRVQRGLDQFHEPSPGAGLRPPHRTGDGPARQRGCRAQGRDRGHGRLLRGERAGRDRDRRRRQGPLQRPLRGDAERRKRFDRRGPSLRCGRLRDRPPGAPGRRGGHPRGKGQGRRGAEDGLAEERGRRVSAGGHRARGQGRHALPALRHEVRDAAGPGHRRPRAHARRPGQVGDRAAHALGA